MRDKPKIFAIYLPQFYETEYNNKWWGNGYTEWTACRQAKQLFKGHYQPRVPLGDNYYDLSSFETIKYQVSLAKEYLVQGFAIYHYYSCGKKLLEIPCEMFRDHEELDFPFFLFWANESWRKTWFGQDSRVVWKQEYGDESDWKKHFNYCLPFFKNKNYEKIDNKPIFVIYKSWDIPNLPLFLSLWNQWAIEAGFSGIFFVKAKSTHDSNSTKGFSAITSREPNYSFTNDENILVKCIRVFRTRILSFINKHLLIPRGKGIVILRPNYEKIWKKIIKRKYKEKCVFLGAFVDSDASPRKSYNSSIFRNASPQLFELYFSKLYKKACLMESPIILVNAWNEWAEGAYLEPDTRYKYQYLMAIKKAQRLDEDK